MKSENALEWAQLLHTELITEEDFRNLRRQRGWRSALTLAGPIGKAQARAFVDNDTPASHEFDQQVRLAFRFLLDESTLLPGSDS